MSHADHDDGLSSDIWSPYVLLFMLSECWEYPGYRCKSNDYELCLKLRIIALTSSKFKSAVRLALQQRPGVLGIYEDYRQIDVIGSDIANEARLSDMIKKFWKTQLPILVWILMTVYMGYRPQLIYGLYTGPALAWAQWWRTFPSCRCVNAHRFTYVLQGCVRCAYGRFVCIMQLLLDQDVFCGMFIMWWA